MGYDLSTLEVYKSDAFNIKNPLKNYEVIENLKKCVEQK